MKIKPDENWKTNNGGAPLESDEVSRYISVVPSAAQMEHSKKPFY